MNKKIFFILILVSFFAQAEYFLELLIYDELSNLSLSTSIYAYLVYVAYTLFHFWLIFSIDIWIIHRIERILPWDTYFIRRIITEFLITSTVSAAITIPLTVFISHHMIKNYFNIYTDGLMYDVYYNLLYILAYNAIFVVTYEGVYLYGERKNLQLEWERTEKENILSQFRALKNQVNPHFLFNSMNALSALIQSDKSRALKFTKEFSKVFRYTLEIKDNTVIRLRKELDFVSAYIYLQKIRYGDNLRVYIDVDASRLNDYLPPFSLQLLLENAIKHNVISTEKPLKIKIENSDDYLTVWNNIQSRSEEIESMKIGLMNLEKRYDLICNEKPTFRTNGTFYVAKLPLLSDEHLN